MVLREPARFRALVLLALVAAARVWCAASQRPTQARAHTTRMACTVLDIGQSDDSRTSYTCLDSTGRAFAVSGPDAPAAVGTRILVRGRIEPFDGPRNPGEPDQQAIQAERGTDARMSGAHVLATLTPAPLNLRIAIAEWHAWALAQLRLRLAEPYATILAGELWGERAALPPDLRAEFQETGTVHVLVTAGLHLGVVAMVVLALLRLCTTPRLVASGIAAICVWCYAMFSGMHLPSMRAAAMISLGLLAHASGSAPRSRTAFVLALLTIAIVRPHDVTSASFALSFSCVGAILLIAPLVEHHLESTGLPERLREALSLTIATQIGTWPITASIFLLFAPYAIPANLLVVPVVAFTMILGGAQLLLTPVPALAQCAADVNAWLLAWIVAVVQNLASIPGSALAMTPPPVWAIAIYDASVIGAVALWKRDGRTPALVLLTISTALLLTPPLFPDRRLRITVLDAGQADAIVIRTPGDRTILVDAGGRLERGSGADSTAEKVGERIVVPFLRRSGVRRIDALIISHPHGDHAGGAPVVLRDFSVTEFADSGQRYGGYAYNDALQTAHGERVPLVYPRAGMVWRTGDGVSLTFIGPSLPFIVSNNTINDNSVAFILQYKHFRMLFTGDAGVAAEQRFLDERLDLGSTILKVGHHGSAYSSSPAFIAAVHPKYAIISVGRHNMFGHPAPSTVATLERFGATVYRTDRNAAVGIVTDGISADVRPMLRFSTPGKTKRRDRNT